MHRVHRKTLILEEASQAFGELESLLARNCGISAGSSDGVLVEPCEVMDLVSVESCGVFFESCQAPGSRCECFPLFVSLLVAQRKFKIDLELQGFFAFEGICQNGSLRNFSAAGWPPGHA